MESIGDSYSILVIIFIMCGGFSAGFIDSIAGGGGLISLPVLLIAGLPPHYALGTNKFSASFGAVMSAYQFFRAGKVDVHLVRKLLPFTFLGSACGVALVMHLSPAMLKPLVIAALAVVAIFVIVKKDWGSISTYGGETKKVQYIWFLSALGLGFYDGFLGPGTGTFLIIGFVMTGFDFVLASGNAKVLNMMSNLTAFCLFIWLKQVIFVYGIAMAASFLLGSYLGARLAIRKGSRFVRIVFIVITFAVIGKLAVDYFRLF
jgi:uncharacterized membrane protein YfcA